MRSAFLVICWLLTAAAPADDVPFLLLANTLRDETDPADYWVSEKYDGIRACWNGRELLTRNGNIIAAPRWFVADLPSVPLDGELWAGRGRFQDVARTVRDAVPDDRTWRDIRFMVFDLPAHPGTFDLRLRALQALQLTAPAMRCRSSGSLIVRAWTASSGKSSPAAAKVSCFIAQTRTIAPVAATIC